jgi:hypothetical protein
VPSDRHLPVARRALSRNPDAIALEIAGVSHLFQPGATRFGDTEAPTGLPYSAPAVRELVVNWLDAHLRPRVAPAARAR